MIDDPCKLRFLRLSPHIPLLVAGIVLCMVNPAAASSKAQEWLSYYQGGSKVSFSRIASFIKGNPDWPAQKRLQVEAEGKLPGGQSPKQLLQWFEDYPPITANAMGVYIQTLQNASKPDEAKKQAGAWWAKADLTRDQQKAFYGTYKNLLDNEAHKKRLDTLLYRGHSANARAIARVLGGSYPALTEARLGLQKDKSNVDALVKAVPASLQSDTGLIYERIRWRRQNDIDAGAIRLLNKAPDFADMYEPGRWWRERHIMVRRLIENRNYAQAYRLASAHRQKEGFPLLQAEWVSGWLALSYLNEPWKAFEHFERLYHYAETPISRARGSYWAGRASDALRRSDIARQWYKVAALYDTTFYGQLAKYTIGEKRGFQSVTHPLPATSKSYNAQPMAVAAKALARMGKKDEANMFIIALRNTGETKDDLRLNSMLAKGLGLDLQAIKAADVAYKRFGSVFADQAYPVLVNEVKSVKDVEWALIHALIRQESRFDKKAVSHAGARGLMQLMPATAKNVARQIGISHNKDWLISRPSHNIKLGAHYIRQMVDRYDGNYALALAAYNAGPARVDRWISEFGDPRKEHIDLIGWIERIPFYETRNYVQRVLEATYVYRGLLENIQSPPTKPIHIAMN